MKSLRYYKNYIIHQWVKHFLQRFPLVYRRIQLYRYRNTKNYKQIVGPGSDILIEGYPRSANSFATRAFRVSNGEDFIIATHLHVYTHVVLGIHYKVPTLCLIRHPKDCVLSYAVMLGNMGGIEEFNARYNMRWLIDDYVVFYKRLKKYKDQFLMATFTEVSTDFGKVMQALNDKCGSSFVPFDHTDENVKTVFNRSDADTYLSPNVKRDEVKQLYRSQLDALKESKAYKEACELYEYWANLGLKDV